MLRVTLALSLSVAGALQLLPVAPRPMAVRHRPAVMGLFDGLQAGLAKLQAGEYDEAEIKRRVENQIRMKPCIIYGMKSCSKCEEARKVLNVHGAVHTYIDFEDDDDGMAIKAELIGLGHSSFPAVFAGGKLLGDVKRMDDAGELVPALISSGSLVPTQRI